MPENITREDIAAVIEEFGVEYLLGEHMNPADAKDSRVRTVLRAVRKNLNALYRLVGIEEIEIVSSEDGVEEDVEVEGAEGEIDAEFEAPDRED